MTKLTLTDGLKRYGWVLMLAVGVPGYVLIAGATGACPACSSVTQALGLGSAAYAGEPSGEGEESSPPPVPDRAEDVKPVKPGERAPSAVLRSVEGEEIDVADRYAAKPTILVFYRGGWCPYCNTHLGQIAGVEADLVKLGYQILAISPDKPEVLNEGKDKRSGSYELLSDQDMNLSRAFGLAFRVDDPTMEKLLSYKIDIKAASGRDHRLLPVPAVYVVDRSGAVRFAHWNADYKKRLEAAELVEAAKAAAEE